MNREKLKEIAQDVIDETNHLPAKAIAVIALSSVRVLAININERLAELEKTIKGKQND